MRTKHKLKHHVNLNMTRRFPIPQAFKNVTAVVNSKAIGDNLAFLRKQAGTDVMAVLKGNAYGHGIVQTARICRRFGVKHLGVATLGEAMQLRNSGDRGRILAWLYDPLTNQVKEAAARGIDIASFDHAHIPILSKSMKNVKKRANVHLFVDTGINRNGVPFDRAVQAAVDISKDPAFNLVGLMSHLCCSVKKNDPATRTQFRMFRELRRRLAALNIEPELVHISPTDGILNYDNSDFTLVRSGDGLFGLNTRQGLTPAMSLSSKIIQIKPIRKGDSVGYDKTYVAKSDQLIAIVPIGYGDLLPRTASEKFSVFVNGTKRNVLGLDSMDIIAILAKKNDALGDEVKIFGDKKKGFHQTLNGLARSASTIPHNIVSHLGERIHIVYE